MRDFYALRCHKMRDCAKKGGREDKRRHVIINKLCISRGLSVVETFCVAKSKREERKFKKSHVLPAFQRSARSENTYSCMHMRIVNSSETRRRA